MPLIDNDKVQVMVMTDKTLGLRDFSDLAGDPAADDDFETEEAPGARSYANSKLKMKSSIHQPSISKQSQPNTTLFY